MNIFDIGAVAMKTLRLLASAPISVNYNMTAESPSASYYVVRRTVLIL